MIRKILSIPLRRGWRSVRLFSDHKYSNKTSKEIEKQVLDQKWNKLQADYKALDSTFGLQVPPTQQLQNEKDFSIPNKYEYSLQSLRVCSRKHPIYLYKQLKRDKSLFHQTIDNIVDNLWKAQKKQVLQILQFMYVWKYDRIDVIELFQNVVHKYQFEMQQIFRLFKLLGMKLREVLQNKVLQCLRKQTLLPHEYQPLLKILNILTVHGQLSQGFYIAITSSISQNINNVSPSNLANMYVYYTYNQQIQNQILNNNEGKESKKIQLVLSILQILQSRILQCIKFMKAQQVLAIAHSYYKNMIGDGRQKGQQYFNKIIDRIQLLIVSAQFPTSQKIRLLQFVSQMPQQKRQLIIAYFLKQLLEKTEKIDYKILVQLYVCAFQANMLTPQHISLLQKLIISNILQMEHHDVSRAAWLFTICPDQNKKNFNKLLYQKIVTIIEGGLNSYELKDIAVIVWSIGVWDIKDDDKHWTNIQYYIQQQLLTHNYSNSVVHSISWILWAYYNNYPLSFKTINIINQILLTKLQQLSVFQLMNITSFYYCLNVPAQMTSVVQSVKQYCFRQFTKLYSRMDIVQLCKVIKFMGRQVWKHKQLALNIIKILQSSVEQVEYKQIMMVIGTLLNSPFKETNKVKKIVFELMQRKKQFQKLSVNA